VRPLVPAHIAAAVAKALARNPADRFSTVDEFVAALRPWSVHQGPTALTSDSAAATSPSPRGYSTPIVLGVTLVALAVGFVAGRMSAP
jgi:uncharacterized protein with beta-barrel porin domain